MILSRAGAPLVEALLAGVGPSGVFYWLVEIVETGRPRKVRIAVAAATWSRPLRDPWPSSGASAEALGHHNSDPIDTTASIPDEAPVDPVMGGHDRLLAHRRRTQPASRPG